MPDASTATIDWLEVALGFVAGLALFLFGVQTLAAALRENQRGRFERLLKRFAGNRFGGVASGTAATVALDSSSVVIILVIAIVDAGLLPFSASLPVILGANIGTTFSSQIFAWNVDQWSPVMLAAALLARAFAKGDKAQAWSNALLGLGLVLFGLHTIGDAAAPLEEDQRIRDWLTRLESPALGILAGALATVAIQSSSAMMGIVITLAGGGLITLPAGIAIMLGAEIGTCADTLMATVGRSRAAVRAGLFHLAFNIVSVGLGYLLIDALAAFAQASASDTGQRIANAHVAFNVAGALLALPFTQAAAKALERVLPDAEGRRAGQDD